MDQYKQTLDFFTSPENKIFLKQIRRGIEKESLRINSSGQLSQKPHPIALGSTLTHSKITTDFAESLLEFITSATDDIEAVLRELADIHGFVYANLADELLWVASMPCRLAGEDSIPIAEYGKSNIGRLKHIYREGLTHRYGKAMQTIAGIHYNFSMPEAFWVEFQAYKSDQNPLNGFQSNEYFALIRNFRRYVWLVMYLYGATPAIDASFLRHKPNYLEQFDANTYVAKYATSLRMSDLGYHNDAQSELAICYNSLSEYLKTLKHAVQTPYAPYEKLGLQKDGKYLQLNTNILQIENEYYGSIRPKRNMRSGERPITALNRDGVEYIEVRCLDINPNLSLGIDADQIKFMDMFLVYCLLKPSPKIIGSECQEITQNLTATLIEGRKPHLTLQKQGEMIKLSVWASEMIEEMCAVAVMFDEAFGSDTYKNIIAMQIEKIKNPDLTPSGQQLIELAENKQSFLEYGLEQSSKIAQAFLQKPLSAETLKNFQTMAETSIAKQKELEDTDQDDFSAFLEKYLIV